MKDHNLPNRNIHSNNSSGKPPPNNSNYSRNQSPYNSNYRGRSPNQRNSRNFSQNRYNRSNGQNNQCRNNYSRSNSNRPEYSFETSSHSHSRNRHYSNERSRNSSYHKNRNYSNNTKEATRKIELKVIKKIDHEIILTKDPIIKDLITTTIKIDHAIIHKIEIRSITIDKETNQSPHRKNTRYPDSQTKYRSNTPKLQRHINQVQTTEDVNSDPPGIDNRESTELQLNHIN